MWSWVRAPRWVFFHAARAVFVVGVAPKAPPGLPWAILCGPSTVVGLTRPSVHQNTQFCAVLGSQAVPQSSPRALPVLPPRLPPARPFAMNRAAQPCTHEMWNISIKIKVFKSHARYVRGPRTSETRNSRQKSMFSRATHVTCVGHARPKRETFGQNPPFPDS